MEFQAHRIRHRASGQAATLTVESGDKIDVQSGATLEIDSGATFTSAGTATFTGPTINAPTGTEASEVVTTTNVILAAESGTTYYLNAAGGFTSTLPAPTLGQRYRFVVKTAPTTAYILTTNAGANILFGNISTGGAAAEANGVAGSAQDTINFVANQAAVGDWVEVRSDGTNWYVSGHFNVVAGVTFAVT